MASVTRPGGICPFWPSPASNELNEVSGSAVTWKVSLSRYGFAGRSRSVYLVPSHSGFGTRTISVSVRGASSMKGPLPNILPFSHSAAVAASVPAASGTGMNSWKPATASKFE